MTFRWLVGLLALWSMALQTGPLSAASPNNQASSEPGVWMDMAMEACEQGLMSEVSRIFEHIQSTFSPEAGVMAWMKSVERLGCPLASHLLPPVLGAIEAPGDGGPQPPLNPPLAQRAARYRLALSMGQNSNANAGPSVTQFSLPSLTDVVLELDESSRPKRHGYIEGRVEMAHTQDKWDWGLQLSARHYPSLTSFDEQGLGVWAERPIGESTAGSTPSSQHWWAGSAIGVSASWVQLGGQDFVQQATLVWRRSPSRQPGWEISQQWQHYPNRSDFDARVGAADWLWQPRADLALRLGAYQDLAQGNRPGGHRLGWRLMASWETRLSQAVVAWAPRLTVGVRGLLDWSRSEQAYSPGILDMRRQHTIRQLDFIAWHPLNQAWSVRGLLSHRLETDEVPILNFRNTGIHLELGYRF